MLFKKILKFLLILLLVTVLIFGIYAGYIFISYNRIEDNLNLSVVGNYSYQTVTTNHTYTAVTQNIGFGAYTSDFTFFMDGGKESRARSEDSVYNCLTLASEKINEFSFDFALIQEVDFDSTRSFHIDEYEFLKEKFTVYQDIFAVNYHSAYLFYPFIKPHGKSNSGILTLSKYEVTSSIRRSLPISKSVSKILDLDRAYSVSRVSVDNGKELVIYNVHLSAYGGSDEVRKGQMTMLFNDMNQEYEKGNYCICGGDFNHDFTGNSNETLNKESDFEDLGWAQPFPTEYLPSTISRALNYENGEILPTCRNCDIPYKKGNFVIIVDGFLTSRNVTVLNVKNVQTDFEYSDHNPVVLNFKLN